MKREWFAGSLLLLLLLLSLINIAFLDRLVTDIESELQTTLTLSQNKAFQEAALSLDRAIDRWNAAEIYLHIFIRHAEIDSTSEAFYDLQQLLFEQNAEGIPSALARLDYHLRCIDIMEHLRPGSIF